MKVNGNTVLLFGIILATIASIFGLSFMIAAMMKGVFILLQRSL